MGHKIRKVRRADFCFFMGRLRGVAHLLGYNRDMLTRWFSRLGRRAAPVGTPVSLSTAGEQVPGLLEYNVLRPAETVTLDDPALRAFLARQKAVPHHDGGTFHTEPIFRATLAEVIFDPSSGAIWTADGSLLIDSIKNAGRLKHVRPAPVADGVWPGLYSSIVGTIAAGNPFHWFIEALPRLFSLADVPEPVTLLMPDSLTAARQAQLTACLPPHVTLRNVPAGTRLRLERFVLPSYLTTLWDFAYPPYEHLAFVRDRLLAANGAAAAPPGHERLYISRAGARVRRVANEEDVVAALQPFGFHAVRLEELPFAEQVHLFRAAEMVVAPHGAGLANVLFAPPLTVVELASRVVSPVYFFLSLALGHDYRAVYPAELNDERLPSPAEGRRYSAQRDRDITIDPAALVAMLRLREQAGR